VTPEKILIFICVTTFGYLTGPFVYAQAENKSQQEEYAGSVSCRSCHEKFYKLWALSHHGLAMQPYTPEFARANLTPQAEDTKVGKYRYRADIESSRVIENGPGGQKTHPIAHVMGGKNVYYFLTPMDRGRLQTLPVAYDVQAKQWFDTAASGVRHFPGAEADEPVHWTDPLYTFNTSCYNCHVSQLSRNYDLTTDTYHTEWSEPGINCETCHGPGQDHVRVCQDASEGKPPKDLKIIVTKAFTAEQINSMCNSCHAKMSPVSSSFRPGEDYFEHFDLTTLEHPDFYPDGRDLGENYTMTGWRISPCAKSGKLDCMHCHTSSGRYRFEESSKANNACLPCHRERVEKVTEHTYHTVETEGSRCIACHMPMTQFAHMNRSDHSMRPPTPAVTIAFGSPNACNLCHKDRDAKWSDRYVRQWHKDDFQKAVLDAAHLIDYARRQDWKRLDETLDYIGRKDREEVVAASLIRLLRSCQSEKKWPVLIGVLEKDPSPLVRSAAADGLDGYFTGQSLEVLLEATRDEYRLVRVRAAASLAGIDPYRLNGNYRKDLERATAEVTEGFKARGDDYVSHYNLGNFYMERREYQQAISSFLTSHRLRPDSVLPLNNIAFAYNAIGQNDKAVESLRKVLALEPESAAVNLNLGMLLGEMGRVSEAEKAFRAAYKSDPNSAVAAYNLGVILARTRPKESLDWCRKAYELRPEEGRYGYTYAFYMHQSGNAKMAIDVLENIVSRRVPYADAYALLGVIYLRSGANDKAAEVYKAAQKNTKLSETERKSFGEMLLRMGRGL
jgi:tetratricopeptide (TPR) repeat protein